MRTSALLLCLALGACASAPPADAPLAPASRAPETTTTEATPPPPGPPPTPPAPPEACGLEAAPLDAADLFEPTPNAWVPLAQRLLGCTPEAASALGLGTPTRTDGTDAAPILTFAREAGGRQRLLVLAYEAGAVVGVSIADPVSSRLTSTVFQLRSLQTQEAAGGDPVPSPEGSLMFAASAQRPYGVRLVASGGYVVLSVVQE
ncbi:hypothetical protein [Rubricoccus marinus]|uniref:Uncharacterized protein n=1 Tax=Rubricoccus marinus TaxID=716817 RepID=A0A259U098_9BACT|nr:hypothetical protein [Rubricoccus marinus]OZC03356.1 hypothetical protein BSZ36_10405 [Rubricoccus marinus]